jgi:hypothetical protein
VNCTTLGERRRFVSDTTGGVVAVSTDPRRTELLETLLADEVDRGVIFVESIARAYSRIKQVIPCLVIIFCEIDDVDACRLLSMLELDDELSGIPVKTFATGPVDHDFEGMVAELLERPVSMAQPVQMN